MKKQVMVRAWALARQGVKKFGGRAVDFFRSALTIAWKEAKAASKIGIDKVKELVSKINICTGSIRANYWEKGEYRRMYVNHTWYVSKGQRRASYGYFEIDKNSNIVCFVPQRVIAPYSACTMREVQAECEKILK